MRQLKYFVATSLDGMIACADGSFECFPMEGDHLAAFLKGLEPFSDVLMGRSTYEVGLKVGVTNPYPRLKSYVFSSSMAESPDPNVQLVSGDAAEFVRNLKQEPGKDIWLCGGSELAASLLAAGLIDEIIVKLNPLLIGSGIPVFARIEKPLALVLVDSKVYNSGVLFLTYRLKN